MNRILLVVIVVVTGVVGLSILSHNCDALGIEAQAEIQNEPVKASAAEEKSIRQPGEAPAAKPAMQQDVNSDQNAGNPEKAGVPEVIDYPETLDNYKEADDAITTEDPAFESDDGTLEELNEALAGQNSELPDINDELVRENGDLIKMIQWVEQDGQKARPEEKFRVTFYSTQADYNHLVPGKTIAMNSLQIAELGLKKGDEIYVRSSKGWSGIYTITDHGCAYGTIDIYVDQGDIPSWGVELDVEILVQTD